MKRFSQAGSDAGSRDLKGPRALAAPAAADPAGDHPHVGRLDIDAPQGGRRAAHPLRCRGREARRGAGRRQRRPAHHRRRAPGRPARQVPAEVGAGRRQPHPVRGRARCVPGTGVEERRPLELCDAGQAVPVE